MASYHERHKIHQSGWLRAAVLGANDGILSTASLMLGVLAAGADSQAVFLAGIAGLVAGGMSMAAGEYVSVSSQADAERAELRRERRELAENPVYEREELSEIYEDRGLDPTLARTVATQLMAKDALGAHARDELGISEAQRPRPVQAALSSAAAFATGALLPILTVLLSPSSIRLLVVPVASLLFLALLGAFAAKVGGASVRQGATRVTILGAGAMALTAGVGKIFGVVA